MNINKLAICFKDNDFLHTFYGVAYTIYEGCRMNGPLRSREQIVQVVNALSWGCYLMFQDDRAVDPRESLSQYFKLGAQDILINEEVTEYVQNKTPEHNSSTYVIDFQAFPANAVYLV